MKFKIIKKIKLIKDINVLLIVIQVNRKQLHQVNIFGFNTKTIHEDARIVICLSILINYVIRIFFVSLFLMIEFLFF